MRAQSPTRGNRRQRGVVLILTLFVILITYALVAQLTLGTSVASQVTRNVANRLQMRSAGEAAADQFLSSLRDDPSVGGQGGLAGIPSMGLGEAAEMFSQGGAGGTFAGGAEEDQGEEGEEEESEEADSWEDTWAKPMRIVLGDIQITARAEDENGKFNLLSLMDPDEERAELARERCERILNRLRDDFDDDLAPHEAARLTENIIQWMKADTRNDQSYPVALRHSFSEEHPRALMWTTKELLLLDGVDESLYFDQLREDNRMAPGLETVFTVWTSMAFDPAGNEESSESPAVDQATQEGDSSAEERSLQSQSGAQTGVEDLGLGLQGGLKGADSSEAGIGVTLNLNTAPRAVLEGMFAEHEFPWHVIQDILEFRNELDEVAMEAMETQREEQDELLTDLQTSFYGEDPDNPRRYFRSLEDLSKIDSWVALSEEVQSELTSVFGVQSDVFTVFLTARIPPPEWQQEDYYQEAPGPVLRLRAVFWRRGSESGVRLVPVIPWFEVAREKWRIPDFQDDLPLYEPPDW